MKLMLKALSAALCLLLVAGSAAQTPVTSLDARIDGLLRTMSINEKIAQLFYKTDGNQRLGIPQFTGSDGPHGIGNKAKGWSSFPVNLAMSATWDPGLIQRVGRAIALEQASRGRHRIAGPVLDLLHDPRNGRAPETIGEDPFLGGRIAEGFLRGMNETSVFATIKHYNLNTYEAGRRNNDYQIDPRSLVEFWGAHWRRAIQDGGAPSVMCAYNLINGEKCAENRFLIKTVLRDLWGFRGYTMSDWDGFWSTENAMAAELDFCEGSELYTKDLPGLIASGRITEKQLDKAVGNVLRTKILGGMLDGQPRVSEAETRDCREHRDLVYECGLKSMVLLKNSDAILPIDPKIRSLALIGPNAANLPLDGHSSSAVIPSYTITPKQGLEMVLGGKRVRYSTGCAINGGGREQFEEAKRLAKESDVVIFVGGLDNTVEGEEHFIKGDRLTNSVDLPGLQNDLIHELAAVNPNMVLVVISGGPCAVNKVIGKVKGLIYAPYPGQEGGRALADILLGRGNPSGKLPVTIPKNDGQLPARDNDFMNVAITGVGYRWYDQQKIQPEFAFGTGLSYTTFEYRNLRLPGDAVPAGQEIVVTVDVTNTGKRSGEEVAQLYLSTGDIKPSVAMPVKQLKGFSKVAIPAGETRRVTFRLQADDLYVFDAGEGRYRLPTGSYTVHVGGSSDLLPLSASLTIAPADERPDLIVTNIRTIPAFPVKGERVRCVASVLNRGTGATPEGKPVGVSFRIDGNDVSSSPVHLRSIPAGGMALVCGSEGDEWLVADRPFTIRAAVDPLGVVQESIETNNVASAIKVPRIMTIGIFDEARDVGAIGLKGSSEYSSAKGEYRITGSGKNIWFDRDAFHFLHRKLAGDFAFSMDVGWEGEGKEPHRKACAMVRQTLDADSPYVDVAVHGDGLIELQYRTEKGGPTYAARTPIVAPATVKLERDGDVFTVFVSKSGRPFQPVGAVALAMPDPVLVGLAVSAHNPANLETAVITKVSLTNRVPETGGKRVRETTLETLDIETGERKIIHRDRALFEAPNWSRDGKLFYINREGGIWTLPLKGGVPKRIDTGVAIKNNNDHGLSTDGKWLAISSGSGENGSKIFVVPAAGGDAREITPIGPSYWHGWSPDDRTLIYCAKRNENFDIYSIPTEGGKETRLTAAEGLDDGCEFTPDGAKIYFHSERAGGVPRIFRMNPDGSMQEQVTFDERYADWFPHPSPDGKWIAFVSFESTVKGHPYDKNVVIRLMPVNGGMPRIIASLFGGQGTMNVPSWSPDSKQIAFVSYRHVLP